MTNGALRLTIATVARTRRKVSSARWRWRLRLAAHRVVAEIVGSEPVLLLDDVFSELDAERSRALVGALPADAQTVVTTAGMVPAGIRPACRLDVVDGRILELSEGG